MSKQRIMPIHPLTPAKPKFVLQWRTYPNSPFCWQIVNLDAKRVYIACFMTQPGMATQPMQQVQVVYSEEEADAAYAAFLEQQKKPQVIVPGSPLWNLDSLPVKRRSDG